jgi:AcrR family transcriptional regulator
MINKAMRMDRLMVARRAARLFLEKGVAGTSGDDIAKAAGLSTRTVWRYFRTKQAAVEPLFAKTSLQFAAQLHDWPLGFAIEEYLGETISAANQTPDDIADGVLVVRLLAVMDDEPDLRANGSSPARPANSFWPRRSPSDWDARQPNMTSECVPRR